MATAEAKAAAQKLPSYREYPYGACRFVEEQFGATPDPWQEQLLVAAVTPGVQRISLQACAGPGKTCGEAWVGLHFLATRVDQGRRRLQPPQGAGHLDHRRQPPGQPLGGVRALAGRAASCCARVHLDVVAHLPQAARGHLVPRRALVAEERQRRRAGPHVQRAARQEHPGARRRERRDPADHHARRGAGAPQHRLRPAAPGRQPDQRTRACSTRRRCSRSCGTSSG